MIKPSAGLGTHRLTSTIVRGIVGTLSLASGSIEVEIDRPLRQDLGAAGRDERSDRGIKRVAARVPVRSTRRQVNIAFRRIR
jgi:hypothetical protein